MTFSFKKDGRRLITITLASALMAVNINTFVHTGGLYPGGATGLTILIRRIIEMLTGHEPPYSPISILINLIPIYIGFRYLGKKLTLYSCYVIVLSGILTDILPSRAITYDTLLISIFGGLINGLVISLCLGMNANTGGTDFIALYLSEKKGIDSFNVVLGINVVILSCAGILFGWDKALYSIIFQFVSTQVIHTLYRRYQQTTLFIVTDYPHVVSRAISEACHHGSTILKGEGAYLERERSVVYSVVSRAEYRDVIAAVRRTDPKAFVNSVRTEELSGRFYRRPTE